MKKKLLVLAIVAVAIMAPAFAQATVTGSTYALDLSFVQNAVNLIVGIFAGSYSFYRNELLKIYDSHPIPDKQDFYNQLLFYRLYKASVTLSNTY